MKCISVGWNISVGEVMRVLEDTTSAGDCLGFAAGRSMSGVIGKGGVDHREGYPAAINAPGRVRPQG